MSNEYFPNHTLDPMEQIYRECSKKIAEQTIKQAINFIREQKEAPTMQVTYNGFTGELVKLERKEKESVMTFNQLECRGATKTIVYDFSLYDSEKQATISFTGVKLEDMKFLVGTVTFDG